MRREWLRGPWIGVLLMLLLLAGAWSVHGVSRMLPVRVTIPVKYETSDDDAEATFVLRGTDAEAPMPEGAVDGEKVISVRGSGDVDFGSILFTKPDAFLYQIDRVDKRKGGDHSRFHVLVGALSGGDKVIVIERDGQRVKPEVVEYVDPPGSVVGKKVEKTVRRTSFRKPGAEIRKLPGHAPGTGDLLNMLPYLATTLLGLCGIVVIQLIRRDMEREWEALIKKNQRS